MNRRKAIGNQIKDDELLETAKRISWVWLQEFWDTKTFEQREEFYQNRSVAREWKTPDEYWEALTPDVKETTLMKARFVLGQTDKIEW